MGCPRFFLLRRRCAGRGGGREGTEEQRGGVAPIREIEGDLESRVEALGLELVNLEWAGSGARPIMRLRVDWTDSKPGAGITVGDCARVSRELERWLDQHPAVPERYVLEVSSPGVERPLKRRRDYERFVGQGGAHQEDWRYRGARHEHRLPGSCRGWTGTTTGTGS